MRKMADNFVAIRRAELLASGAYDAARDEATLANLDWRSFTDEEFGLCPPIVSMGGDGAMLDIGFQNLSRLLASGKPIRVIVLDTQVYSNTGGQACTSGFTGQVSDMATYGAAQHGKTEVRKELALVAMAHRGAYVHQSSQASASHLVAGVLRGLQKRRPAVFNIYTPCPVEHGLADDWSMRAARLALESRAFPFLTFDPDAGPLFADALTLDGNPSVDQRWPEYGIDYVDDAGAAQRIDAAAHDRRLGRHRRTVQQALHAARSVEMERGRGAVPRVPRPLGRRPRRQDAVHPHGRPRQTPRAARGLDRDRAARRGAPAVLGAAPRARRASSRRRACATGSSAMCRRSTSSKLAAVRAEYEAKLAELPKVIARRMADVLLRGGAAKSVVDLRVVDRRLAPRRLPLRYRTRDASRRRPTVDGRSTPQRRRDRVIAGDHVQPSPSRPSRQPATRRVAVDDDLAIDPYIDSARCTSCNECTNLNGRLFAYNAAKQATVRDADAGTFQQLVSPPSAARSGSSTPARRAIRRRRISPNG